ncbi:VUT family protein [Flaviaesturariibacter flavus]|uniref:Probable queuosine precursor transporter n=1 Tax=Flaviaesturariibacter flavus TaxID=2502780 RepID=A0A4V2NWI0_9BACT|nr:queuosine precursor transporter [Flaviaesturariibacter flavus]TCJ17452.1 VUT family protein [Flaviaesturariibacter flavus]
MVSSIVKDKPTKLLLAMSAFFVANALIAESIGTKIFSFEKLVGVAPVNFTMFGQSGLAFNLTCGVLLWPLEFIMTDIVNEFYGPKVVRRISLIAICLIAYAFLMYFMAIGVPPADFWIGSGKRNGIDNMQTAFSGIFGQGMRIIVGSIVAFGVSQLVDVYVFHKIKKATGGRHIWLRATGSTLVSQLVDSYIVLFIAFWGVFTWQQILSFGIMNYIYKFTAAIVLTPAIVWVEKRIEKYLGRDVSDRMKRSAAGDDEGEVTPIPTAG